MNPDFQNLSGIVIGTSTFGIEAIAVAVFILTVKAGDKTCLPGRHWQTHYWLGLPRCSVLGALYLLDKQQGLEGTVIR